MFLFTKRRLIAAHPEHPLSLSSAVCASGSIDRWHRSISDQRPPAVRGREIKTGINATPRFAIASMSGASGATPTIGNVAVNENKPSPWLAGGKGVKRQGVCVCLVSVLKCDPHLVSSRHERTTGGCWPMIEKVGGDRAAE